MDLSHMMGDLNISISMRDAMFHQYITDYRVFIPVINELGDEENCAQELQLSETNIDDEFLSQSLFLLKCMLFQGSRKTITYLSTIQQIQSFHTMVERVAKDFFGIQDIFVGAIVSDTPKTTRIEQLAKFENFDGFAIMLNIRILSEVIDIPATDSIYIAVPCRNKIAAVQRVCRANRLDPNDAAKMAKVYLWADAISDLTEFIASLKEVDPEFPSKISAVSRRYSKSTTETTAMEEMQTKSVKRFSIDVQEYIGDNAARALENAKEYVLFYKNRAKHPAQAADDSHERQLAQWINNYKRGSTGHGTMKERPEVNEILDSIPFWNDSRSTTTMDTKIIRIKQFIRDNGKVPQGKSSPLENELSVWISRQREPEKYDTGNYSALMDAEFSYTYHGVIYKYWRDPVEFPAFVKAQVTVQSIIDKGMQRPKKVKGEDNSGYTLYDTIQSKMRGSGRKQKVFKSTIALFYDKVPGILPSVEECIDEFKVV